MRQLFQISNRALNSLDRFNWNLIKYISTIYMRIILILKGIGVGDNVRFYGKTKFVRQSKAIISIGSFVQFRSLHTSNLIGINRPCIITALLPDSKLQIGDKCGFSGSVIGCFKQITIGNNVKVGANTLITDGDWHPEDFRSGSPREITIDNNVWIGEGVKILKGVHIGENSVIGAGSVVTKDIPKNTIAAGNPCKIISKVYEK